MNTILVTAAPDLRVPLENNPHEYIESSPVVVDSSSLYYRRLLADGDLLLVTPPASGKVQAKVKELNNG